VLVPVKAILPRLVQLLQAVLEALTGDLLLVLQVDFVLLQAFHLQLKFRNGCMAVFETALLPVQQSFAHANTCPNTIRT